MHLGMIIVTDPHVMIIMMGKVVMRTGMKKISRTDHENIECQKAINGKLSH